MAPPPDHVCLGAIAGAFGVHGEVRLKSFCAEPSRIADYSPLVTEDGTSLTIRVMHVLKGALAVRISGVDDRAAAEALKGTRLYFPRERLPALDADEFYHADLIGLDVIDTGGAMLGRVKAVLDHGAGDILEIARPGGADLLLPFTRDFVPTIDLTTGRLVIDPPEGMLEE